MIPDYRKGKMNMPDESSRLIPDNEQTFEVVPSPSDGTPVPELSTPVLGPVEEEEDRFPPGCWMMRKT